MFTTNEDRTFRFLQTRITGEGRSYLSHNLWLRCVKQSNRLQSVEIWVLRRRVARRIRVRVLWGLRAEHGGRVGVGMTFLLFLLGLVLPAHRGIPVILYRIVCSSRQILGDFRPPIPKLLVQLVNESVFVLGPCALFDIGIEVVVPTLATLFPSATLQMFRYQSPPLRSILLD